MLKYKWFSIGKYKQRVSNNITCTCQFGSLYPGNYEEGKNVCKHIKQIIMGQDEICNLLKENGGWMSIVDMAKKLEQSRSSVTIVANKLLKLGYAEKRVVIHPEYHIKQFEFKLIE